MIPIKLNSERVPGKNIKRFFDGTPLVELIQKACLSSKNIDETYIYCSDPKIEEYTISGVKYLQRPEYLDGDDINCNDIIREFIKTIDADIYVVSHATGPFTRSESIDVCIEKVSSREYDSAFLARKMQEFLWQDNTAMNFDIQNFPRTQDLKPVFSEASGAFVFPKDTFIKFNRRVGVKPYIHEVDTIEAMDIDLPIDFLMANIIYKEIIKNEDSN